MTPEWRPVSTETSALGLDEAEVAAFTGMVRAFLLYRPTNPINVFVGWCANDYQIDAGTADGRAEYRRLIGQAVRVRRRSTSSTRRRTPHSPGARTASTTGAGSMYSGWDWDRRSGRTNGIRDRARYRRALQEMLDYARGKRVGLLAYVYPVLPFSQNPEWLVPSRTNPTRQSASLANRALQDWLIEELVAFHHRTEHRRLRVRPYVPDVRGQQSLCAVVGMAPCDGGVAPTRSRHRHRRSSGVSPVRTVELARWQLPAPDVQRRAAGELHSLP